MYRTRVHSKGNDRPTRDDVAKRANISGATVSRVLSGRTDLPIHPETRARVLEAARALGYTPNSAARALTVGRTGIVGFWMSLDYSRYRAQVLGCMRAHLHGTDLAMAVSDVDEVYSQERTFDRALRTPVDGVIAFDNSASVDAFARESDRLAPLLPFVSMGAYWSESKSFVGIDLRAGAEAAMEHLIQRNYRRIAYVAPYTSDLIDSGPRFTAYQSAMTAAGFEPRTIGIEYARYASIRPVLDDLISQRRLPEALLCMNDDVALCAATLLHQSGIRVGQDIAIVGFDGIEESAYGPVPITTVRQPIDEMCARAVAYLNDQIANPEAEPRQSVLVPELIVRESSGG